MIEFIATFIILFIILAAILFWKHCLNLVQRYQDYDSFGIPFKKKLSLLRKELCPKRKPKTPRSKKKSCHVILPECDVLGLHLHIKRIIADTKKLYKNSQPMIEFSRDWEKKRCLVPYLIDGVPKDVMAGKFYLYANTEEALDFMRQKLFFPYNFYQ